MSKPYYYKECWFGNMFGRPAVSVGAYVIFAEDARRVARLAYRRRRAKKNLSLGPRKHKCKSFSLKIRPIFFSRAGHVSAGCTTVMWKEISRLGRKLGWFKGLKPL